MLSKDVTEFAELIEAELNKEDKKNWKGKDTWWYLSQMVKDLRELDSKLTADSKSNVSNIIISLAANALVLDYNQKLRRKR